jgi:phospholipid transport system substrate-binding protein
MLASVPWKRFPSRRREVKTLTVFATTAMLAATSLLSSYGSALIDFTSDRLQILPVKADPNTDHATVRTWVKRNNGDRIAVYYQMRRVNNDWKAWDVNIDGISYIKSYQEDFDEQIDQQGLDSVIARLEKVAKASQVNKANSGGKS